MHLSMTSHSQNDMIDTETSRDLSTPADHLTTHIIALKPILLATLLKSTIDLLGNGDTTYAFAAALATAEAPNKQATLTLATDEHTRPKFSSLLHHYHYVNST